MGPGALARSGLARLNEYQAHYPLFKGVFSKQFMAVSSRKAVLWREGRPGMVSHTRMWATFRQSTRASPRDLAFKIPSDQVCSMDKGYCTARCDQELEDWKRWGPYAWTSQATVPLINEFSCHQVSERHWGTCRAHLRASESLRVLLQDQDFRDLLCDCVRRRLCAPWQFMDILAL